MCFKICQRGAGEIKTSATKPHQLSSAPGPRGVWGEEQLLPVVLWSLPLSYGARAHIYTQQVHSCNSITLKDDKKTKPRGENRGNGSNKG